MAYSYNGGLRYARRSSEGWVISDIVDDAQGEIGPIAMAMDDGDTAHILYAVAAPSGTTQYRTHWDSGEITGVHVSGASHGIEIERNLIRNCTRGIVFDSRSSGVATFNTVVAHALEGMYAGDAYTWLESENNIVANNAVGQRARRRRSVVCQPRPFAQQQRPGRRYDGARDSYLLIRSSAAAIRSLPPRRRLTPADPYADVPVGGGIRADMGYKELIAAPLPLLFGKKIRSTVTGNSGVQSTEMAVKLVADPAQPVTDTLPALWPTATHSSPNEPVSQWQRTVTPASEGLYRVYSRASDVVGNEEADLDSGTWYAGAYIADATPPSINWVMPTANTSSDQAAMLLVAEASDYVDSGDGPRFSIEQFHFAVDGTLYDAEWEDDPDWDPNAMEPRRFQAHIPLKQGSQTIQAVVVDAAGHESHTTALVIDATNAQHVATVTSHDNGEAVRDRDLRLRGYVRYASGGSGNLDVAIDAGAALPAYLDNPLASLTAWRCDAELPDSDGYHTVQVTPDLGSPGMVTTMQILLDRAGPVLDLTRPADGEAVTGTIHIEGTTSDTLSSVHRVEFSIDGGYTWIEMQPESGAFQQAYDVPQGEDSVSYPVRVRSTDWADNATIVRPPGLRRLSTACGAGSHHL